MLVVWWITRALPTLIRQLRDRLFYGDCRSCAAQNAVLPFFENSLKCVCFCLITALFDYHWTQILCEVEKQATCMPMSPGCLRNSGPPLIVVLFHNRISTGTVWLHSFQQLETSCMFILTSQRLPPLISCMCGDDCWHSGWKYSSSIYSLELSRALTSLSWFSVLWIR